MQMQMSAPVSEGRVDAPTPGKRTAGEQSDAFAALLWLWQAGPMPEMAADVSGQPAPAAVPPGFGHVSMDAFAQRLAALAGAATAMAAPAATAADAESEPAAGAPFMGTAAASMTAPSATDDAEQRAATVTAESFAAVANARTSGRPFAAAVQATEVAVSAATERAHAAPVQAGETQATLSSKALSNGSEQGARLAALVQAPAGSARPAVAASALGAMIEQAARAHVDQRESALATDSAPQQPLASLTLTDLPVAGGTGAEAVTPQAAAAEVPASPWLQVVRQLEQRGLDGLTPGGQTLDLQLHPAELGTVRLRLTYNAGQLAAELQVASAAVKEALEAGLPQLRETLQAQGFDVHGLTVDVRDGGEPHGRERDPAWQLWDRSQHGGGLPHDSEPEPLPAAAAAYRSAGLLDIRA